MDLFDLTLDTPEENLALDEALLEEAETSAAPMAALRLWEPPQPIVVVGRSSHVDAEVDLEQCRRRNIGVFRRTSGGAAIVTGPGCLMYAVVLDYERNPALRSVDAAHRIVLETMLEAVRPLVPQATRRGTSDLAVGCTKFSGNSMRCKRRHVLYHGTLLYQMPLELIDQCLRMPPRQPDYRAGRAHGAFVMNLPVAGAALRQALIRAWRAQPSEREVPHMRIAELIASRYGREDWNYKL